VIEVLVTGPDEDVSIPAAAGGAALAILVAVVGSYALRRLTAAWVRRQPPDPPRAGPMNG
jgi:hypothetical protein